MGPAVEVTVVVCTRNGAAHLRTHLSTIAASVGGASSPAELIVVDNGSTDDTVAAAHDVAPEARVVSQPRAGLARARNAGVAAARGRVVLFTDDDVEVPLSWVDRMSEPLLAGSADVVVGGIEVDESLREPWMSPWLLAQFAHHPEPSEENAFVVGANFGARTDVLRELPFDENLGAPPYQREEDAFFWVQARERHLRVRGVRGEPIKHLFDRSRLVTPALISLAETMGRCEAYVWHHWLHGDAPHLKLKELVYGADLAVRRVPRGAHPSDTELRRIARLAFVRELRRLEGTERHYPSPEERSRR